MSYEQMYFGKRGMEQSYPPRRWGGVPSRRPFNRHETEGNNTEGVRASTKKLKGSAIDVDVNHGFGYRIINVIAVFSTIAQHVKCKRCDSNISFQERNPRGLGFKIVIACPNCPDVEIPSSRFIRNAYEINRRIVLAMRLLGIGLNGITKFCAFMELPLPVHSFYDQAVNMISDATKYARDASIRKAAQEEKKKSEENGQSEGITVSGDGSWRKRGFSSLFGITSLIGWFTGKIVDVEVKSKYCESCERWKSKSGTLEYEEWRSRHVDECQANHDDSSGKMEANAVIEMFSRSETLHGLKYANYIDDGDSNTFEEIKNTNPYKDFEVQKKECIDHAQKRMGTRLRNLKKTVNGFGSDLTPELIDQLTNYYGLAIRRNANSLEDMKNEIWAPLFHKLSTDENPQHEICPDSWCDWKKAESEGTLDAYHHEPRLPKVVFEAIKPIYDDLTRDELLNGFLGGYTHKSNESFKATAWKLAPKSYSTGKKVLDLATNLALCNFNDGLTSMLQIMKFMEMDVGIQSYNFCSEADAKRMQQAEQSLTDEAKEARSSIKYPREEKVDEYSSLQGQLYGPGISD